MSYPPGPGHYGTPSPYGPLQTQVITQRYQSSTAHIVIAWIVAVLTLGYMLPWAIAATRNKSNTAVIALVNLLLGWSLVGWIVALVMSLTSEPQPVVYVNTAIMPTQYPAYGQPPMLPSPPPHQWSPPRPQPHGYAEPTQHGSVQPSESTAILPPYDHNHWQPPSGNGYR